MGIISWIVLGFLAGLLAEMATGRRAGGCLTKVAVGVIGALLGGAIAQAAGHDGIDRLDLWSILIAFAGASVLLLVLGASKGRRR
ncbi:MAG TPA: GlsB/YeaQ/YmgE family stress response membrane protein [Acidimicrobiales bacterium]|nr:GlsB/YeaQ/YmgE family stress response membrane protein [Acidimicrobiales bacterium]